LLQDEGPFPFVPWLSVLELSTCTFCDIDNDFFAMYPDGMMRKRFRMILNKAGGGQWKETKRWTSTREYDALKKILDEHTECFLVEFIEKLF
jgi:hypothetical protein